MTLHALLIATFLLEDSLQPHSQADLAEHVTSPHKNTTCRERPHCVCMRYVENSSVCGYCFRNPFVDTDLTSLLFSCLPTIDNIGLHTPSLCCNVYSQCHLSRRIQIYSFRLPWLLWQQVMGVFMCWVQFPAIHQLSCVQVIN